ncbi:hypothetical protein ALI144C_16515 [Actinosynnema sp. ALI-1.44]|uniref:hypothetical protein n=1 Tax=Actinosynnema sp. ALI-1.44 TaxID=1933779 RepID=UPI00097BE4F2|nr:hypothetical protein [Actinosynnema sp. ALI-1.44]ONI83109.1 hypothetical protein ALI144C_16515 [Actinosynnema sp. ALI-1.44]
MNQFWVDPESLSRTGEGYNYVKDRLTSLKRTSGDLGYRYQASFGDDDVGREFFTNFQDGQKIFVDGVDSQAKRIGYVGDGLNENGRIYGAARDDAEIAAHRFRTAAENGPADSTKKHYVDGKPPVGMTMRSDGDAPDGQKTPFNKAVSNKIAVARDGGGAVPSKKGIPPQKPNLGVEPNKNFVKSQRPFPGSYPLRGIDRESLQFRSPEMISALGLHALRENEQPMVGGRPLEPGQRIVSATELPGGVVWIGIDRYSSITPLGPDSLTLQDPNDPNVSSPYPVDGKQRLFLVTVNPEATDRPYNEQVFMEIRGNEKPSYYRYDK